MQNLPRRLKARLPATPCTPEMRASFEALARENDCDLADIQREAFSFFLRSLDTERTHNDTSKCHEQEKVS